MSATYFQKFQPKFDMCSMIYKHELIYFVFQSEED